MLTMSAISAVKNEPVMFNSTVFWPYTRLIEWFTNYSSSAFNSKCIHTNPVTEVILADQSKDRLRTVRGITLT